MTRTLPSNTLAESKVQHCLKSNFLRILFLLLLPVFLTACGGGGGGGGDSAISATNTGVFLDSAVEGVKYETSSGLQGFTDSKGRYQFRSGDTVEFLIGDVSLGVTSATPMLTTENFPFPIQVAQFLQTLDDDGIADNGIKVIPELHVSPLFQRATSKVGYESAFATDLNIRDFDSSTNNQLFLNDISSETGIIDRDIVSSINAVEHKNKSEALRRIYENNTELYSYIKGTFVRVVLPNNSNLHNMLASRLSYYMYKNVYRRVISSEVSLLNKRLNNVEFLKEDVDKFVRSYFNVAALTTQVALFVADEKVAGLEKIDRATKIKVLNSVKSSGKSNVYDFAFNDNDGARDIVELVESCIDNIKWIPSIDGAVNYAVGKAGKVFDCAVGQTARTTNKLTFLLNDLGVRLEYQAYAIADKYLETYFSCGYLNNDCMSSEFNGEETLDGQLQFVMDEWSFNLGIDFVIKDRAKIVIYDYITRIAGFSNAVSNYLPNEDLFNSTYADRNTNSLDLAVRPLKLTTDDGGVLWVDLDVSVLSATKDMYLTSFTPKFVIGGQKFTVASDYYGDWANKLFDRTFYRSSSVNSIRIPISLGNNSLPEAGIARLILTVDYMSTDRASSNLVQRVIDLDLAELRSSNKIEQLDAQAISLSRIIDSSDERSRYYLPNALLDGNVFSAQDEVTWEVNPNSHVVGNTTLGSDDNGQYIDLPALRDGYSSDKVVLNAFINSSPYSEPAIFALNIAKAPFPQQKRIILPGGAILEKWVDLPDFGSITDTYMGVNAYANNSNYTGIYQCTDLVKRFYYSVFNINRSTTGNGKYVALNYSAEVGTYNNQSVIVDYNKNSLSKLQPENGSIVSFSRNDDIGHVAIVKNVVCSTETNCTVSLFEQNWIWTSGNKISHSRTATFTKKGEYWSGQDNETNNNNVIGWTTIRLNGENLAPIADAGLDKFVELNARVTLDGSNSRDDGIITKYEWIQNNAVFAIAQKVSSQSFAVGKHQITLKVTDNFGKSSTDDVSIIVYDAESDTDLDGMTDAWEIANNLNPSLDDSGLDADADGIINLQEFLDGTDPQNSPPIANDQTVKVNQNSLGNAITLAGSDPEGSHLTYTIATYPQNGTLSGITPNLIYTPTSEYAGVDGFTFSVNDGVQGSLKTASVSIEIITLASDFVSFRDVFSSPVYGAYHDGNYVYETLHYDEASSRLVFTDFEYSQDSNGFVERSGSGYRESILTADGVWVDSDRSGYYVTAIDGDTATLSIDGGVTSPKFDLTISITSLSGKSVFDWWPGQWQDAFNGNAVTFQSGAYNVSGMRIYIDDYYAVEMDSNCSQGANCNNVVMPNDGSDATSIYQLISQAKWDGLGILKAFGFKGLGGTQVEFVDGGVANYYIDRVLVASGQFTVELKGSVDVLIAIVPEELDLYFPGDGSEGASIFFAERNGYVFDGEVASAGDTVASMDIGFNQPAMNDVLDNFSPRIEARNVIHGNFRFVDQSGVQQLVPDGAWIRLVPSYNQVEDNYKGINCQIFASTVNPYVALFGFTECYVDDVNDIAAFEDLSETFHMVVYEDSYQNGQWEPDEYKYCHFDPISHGGWTGFECR